MLLPLAFWSAGAASPRPGREAAGVTNLAHIAETALLVLAAYLIGCVLGYALHRVLHAARGTRQVAPLDTPAVIAAAAEPAPGPRRVPTSAARLAAAGGNDPLPLVSAAPPRQAKPRTPAAIDPKTFTLSAPRHGGADNLKQIRGIGPKIESSLNALGVFHFDQMAAWTRPQVEWIESHLAFKGRVGRERWIEQAAELARVVAPV